MTPLAGPAGLLPLLRFGLYIFLVSAFHTAQRASTPALFVQVPPPYIPICIDIRSRSTPIPPRLHPPPSPPYVFLSSEPRVVFPAPPLYQSHSFWLASPSSLLPHFLNATTLSFKLEPP